MIYCWIGVIRVYLTLKNRTHSFSLTSSSGNCNMSPERTNLGPHQANAPVTNDMQVNPAVESMKLGLEMNFWVISTLSLLCFMMDSHFLHRDLMSSIQDVLCMWLPPSLSPLTGSCTTNRRRNTASKPNAGVTLRPQCHEPPSLAASLPIMYPKPLEYREWIEQLLQRLDIRINRIQESQGNSGDSSKLCIDFGEFSGNFTMKKPPEIERKFTKFYIDFGELLGNFTMKKHLKIAENSAKFVEINSNTNSGVFFGQFLPL